MSNAASSGNIQMLERVYETGCISSFGESKLIDVTGSVKNFNILQWLLDKGFPLHKAVCERFAYLRSIDILQWLIQVKGCPYDKVECAAQAAKAGHLHILQWLKVMECPWHEEIELHASWHRNFHVIKCAIKNGSPWFTHVPAMRIAFSGNLEFLKWARKHGCPWNATTCAYAASGGHLELLAWARENGCPWDEKTCQFSCSPWPLACVEMGKKEWVPME